MNRRDRAFQASAPPRRDDRAAEKTDQDSPRIHPGFIRGGAAARAAGHHRLRVHHPDHPDHPAAHRHRHRPDRGGHRVLQGLPEDRLLAGHQHRVHRARRAVAPSPRQTSSIRCGRACRRGRCRTTRHAPQTAPGSAAPSRRPFRRQAHPPAVLQQAAHPGHVPLGPGLPDHVRLPDHARLQAPARPAGHRGAGPLDFRLFLHLFLHLCGAQILPGGLRPAAHAPRGDAAGETPPRR